MNSTICTRNIVLITLSLFVLMVLRELVKYFISSWLAFCVFYTMNDLYRKKRYVIKYYKVARKFGIIPEISLRQKKPIT